MAACGLLAVVGDGHGVELARGVVAAQYAAGVFPCDGRAGFDLRPREFRRVAAAEAAFGHEVVDASAAFGIAGIPVLHGAVFYLGAVLDYDFHDGRVQLVFVAHGRGASFEVAHVAVVVGHDERALELARACGVDSEVCAELHGAAHAFGYVDERAVGEHGGVERGEKVVAVAYHRAEIAAHQVGIVFDGLAEGAEYDAFFGERLAVCGLDAHGVHHGVDGHARQGFLLLQGYAEAVEGVEYLRVHFVEAFGALGGAWRGVVADGLIVDGRDVEVCPLRHFEREPVAVGLEAEVEQPLGLVFEPGDGAHDVFAEPSLYAVCVDVADESVLVFALCGVADYVVGRVLFAYVFVRLVHELRFCGCGVHCIEQRRRGVCAGRPRGGACPAGYRTITLRTVPSE